MKLFVLDTNVPMYDPECIEKFEDNGIVVPIEAIEEMDKAKNFMDEAGANARMVSRLIDERSKETGMLQKGVPTEHGGILYVDYNGTSMNSLPVRLERSKDNQIIAVAAWWQKKIRSKRSSSSRKQQNLHHFSEVILISKDTNVRIKARACGITAQDYMNDKLISSIEKLYTGFRQYDLTSAEEYIFNDQNIYKSGYIPENLLRKQIDLDKLLANQCCEFVLDETSYGAIYERAAQRFRLIRKLGKEAGQRVQPINPEQRFAYELLMDPSIALVTLSGKAGSGKTLMALLAGYKQMEHLYDQLLIYRPTWELGKAMGFLPGSLEEKFSPFMAPIIDNMKLITGGPKKNAEGSAKDGNFSILEEHIRAGTIDMKPINFLRGRSIHNCYMIVDETQNLTPHEIKSIITRAGEGTKIVLTGDPMQIDAPFLDSISNGLSYTIERLKGRDMFGHIALQKSERSPLAALAADLL